jgi:NitT/TauT family transport system substrate-binding protein
MKPPIAFAAILIVSAAASCSRTVLRDTATPRPPMRVARSFWPGAYWTDIAIARGWFAEEGLEVAGIDTDSDYYGSINDLVAGRLDAQQIPIYDLVLRNLAGADLVAVIAGDESSGDSIIARPEIRSPADLKGKVIAVTPDTYLEYLVAEVLQHHDMTLADVTIKPVSLENSGKALSDPAVAAVVSWEPYSSEALAGGNHVIYSSADIPGLMPDVWVFRRRFIDERPEDVRKFVAVWRRTTEHILRHPRETYAEMARIEQRPMREVEAINRSATILGLAQNRTEFSYAAGSESLHGSARRINRFLTTRGKAARTLDTTLFINPEYIRGLE